MKKLLSLMCAMAMLCCYAQAQTGDDDAMMKAWMTYMTPGDIHKMLAADDGVWKQDVTMWMKPGAPPQKSTSTANNRMILGGRYQESISTGMMDGMPFEGRSVVGYDNAKKVMVSTWIDNMGTGIMYMEGTPSKDGKTVEFKGNSTDPMTGKNVPTREIYTMVDNDTRKMEMFMMEKGKEFKVMEIVATRQK